VRHKVRDQETGRLDHCGGTERNEVVRRNFFRIGIDAGQVPVGIMRVYGAVRKDVDLVFRDAKRLVARDSITVFWFTTRGRLGQ